MQVVDPKSLMHLDFDKNKMKEAEFRKDKRQLNRVFEKRAKEKDKKESLATEEMDEEEKEK